jgi:hypothetical protein
VTALNERLAGRDWPSVGGEASDAVALDDELEDSIDMRNAIAEELARADARVLELRGLAAEAGREPLLPEGVDLAGGEVTVADQYGNIVGRYRITNGDLATALELAGVEKVTDGSE